MLSNFWSKLGEDISGVFLAATLSGAAVPGPSFFKGSFNIKNRRTFLVK